jgi:hypothetical protein
VSVHVANCKWPNATIFVVSVALLSRSSNCSKFKPLEKLCMHYAEIQPRSLSLSPFWHNKTIFQTLICKYLLLSVVYFGRGLASGVREVTVCLALV